MADTRKSKLDVYTDKQLIEIAKKSTSLLEFAGNLGYSSDSTLRTEPYRSKIRQLGIKFKSKYTVPVKFKISDELILSKYKECTSVTGLMRACGLKKCSGYVHDRFKKRIAKLGIVYDPLATKKVNGSGPRRPIGEYLVLDGPQITSSTLRKRIIKVGLLENICNECGQLPTWNNKPLVHQLDHINGNRRDNRIENLRILCPNCHTQTDTYAKMKEPTIMVFHHNQII